MFDLKFVFIIGNRVLSLFARYNAKQVLLIAEYMVDSELTASTSKKCIKEKFMFLIDSF